MYGIRVLKLADGSDTPFDGQWLREYDPDRRGVDPLGRAMLAHITCTTDPTKARAFEKPSTAWKLWGRQSRRWPLRPDRLPNRPLTAFTVEIAKLPQEREKRPPAEAGGRDSSSVV